MSLLPPNILRKDLVYQYQWAALDLAVPASLTDEQDKSDWVNYVRYMPPGKLLAKFGEAMDALIAACPADGDLNHLDDAGAMEFVARWNVAVSMTGFVQSKISYIMPAEEQRKLMESDIGYALHHVVEFCRAAFPDHAAKWEFREQANKVFETQKSAFNDVRARALKAAQKQSPSLSPHP